MKLRRDFDSALRASGALQRRGHLRVRGVQRLRTGRGHHPVVAQAVAVRGDRPVVGPTATTAAETRPHPGARLLRGVPGRRVHPGRRRATTSPVRGERMPHQTGLAKDHVLRSPSTHGRGRISRMERPIEEVRRLLDTLPPEASFEDIQYHIYVQQAIRQGLEAAERGELLDQEEVERRMSKWLGE